MESLLCPWGCPVLCLICSIWLLQCGLEAWLWSSFFTE